MVMTNTRHYIEERQEREQFISNVIGDTNKVICTNVIDRGHRNGAERFELTDKAIIRVYNDRTNRHITDIIARPNQVYDRMGDAFLELKIEVRRKIIDLAREHQRLGYNQK
jgi:hypothetical protein